jgi:hypothetical protein
MEDEAGLIIRGHPLRDYTPEETEDILAVLRIRRVQAIENEDYVEVQTIMGLISELVQRSELDQVLRIQQSKADDMESKAEELRQSGEVLKERWEAVLEQFRERRQRELEQMRNQKEAELQEIESRKHQPPPAKFHKYSTHLLSLRASQRAMAAAKRFDEAARIQAEADKIQYQEDEKNWWAFIRSIDEQWLKASQKWDDLIKRHELTLDKQEEDVARQEYNELRSAAKRLFWLERQAREAEQPVQAIKASRQSMRRTPRTARPDQKRSNLPNLRDSRLQVGSSERPQSFAEKRILNMRVYSRGPSGKSGVA